MNQRAMLRVSDAKTRWKRIQEHDLQGKAAQVAYHLLFSIVPLLIFLTALSAFIGQRIGVEDAMTNIREWLADRLSQKNYDAVIGPIDSVVNTSTGGLLSFGALAALWGGKNAISAVMDALNAAFGVEETRPWWKRQLTAIALTVLLGVAAVSGSAALVLGSSLGGDIADSVGLGGFWTSAWRWLQLPAGVGMMMLVLMVLYWRGPNIAGSFRSMWRGALVTVLLWIAALIALSIYFSRFAGYLGAAYGALGGVMAFVFLLYVMSLVMLIGGEINAAGAKWAPAGASESGDVEETQVRSGSGVQTHHRLSRRGAAS